MAFHFHPALLLGLLLATYLVLAKVGIPPAGTALIMGVDRILDMSRTALNVCGDLVASVVMNLLVPAETSIKQELAKQRKLDKIRKQTGEHIIVDPA